jgi:hypothetical protein
MTIFSNNYFSVISACFYSVCICTLSFRDLLNLVQAGRTEVSSSTEKLRAKVGRHTKVAVDTITELRTGRLDDHQSSFVLLIMQMCSFCYCF